MGIIFLDYNFYSENQLYYNLQKIKGKMSSESPELSLGFRKIALLLYLYNKYGYKVGDDLPKGWLNTGNFFHVPDFEKETIGLLKFLERRNEIEFGKIYYNNKNTKMKKEQSYRASVGALIIDKDFNFLMVKLAGEKEEKYDFVKGGMNWGEDYKDTIKRELKEELGKEFKYEIIGKSDWFFFYDWDRELQERKGFRGQMRQNFWIKYISGKIILDKNELSSYKWVKKRGYFTRIKKIKFS
ncbi:NUDIX hydrolase [Candidatus Gracilibacteria bacterium]|nr:NUDIX hydrolase [Candidatus Gracilibacteria bacterium]